MNLCIKSLELENFRNYETLSIEFSEDLNVFYGNNGQGKTNILEALFICATGRSHKTTRDAELIRKSMEGYKIKLHAVRNDYPVIVEIEYKEGEKRKISINSIPLMKIGELMGCINAVIFSPEDLMVIKEGPSDRRRFIDITISQIKPSYFYDLQNYSKILQQRNAMLKSMEYGAKKEVLDIWDKQLTSVGARIIHTRRGFIKKLANLTYKNGMNLTNKNEEIELIYSSSFESSKINESITIMEIEEIFISSLRGNFQQEVTRGVTLSGPHRDDYIVRINELDIRNYGSQGQQRTAILAIKLAEIELVENETGIKPVIILDDVMSELDNNRREYLLKSLNNIQSFITCTEKSNYISMINQRKIFLFEVSSGNVGFLS